MLQYLSPEWLAEADRALAGAKGTGEASIVVEQVVTAGPDGDRTFHVGAGAHGLWLRPGPAPEVTVTFVQDYTTAAAIARGDLSAQAAFMSGRIRVHGDLPRLVEQSDALRPVDDVFAGLRARTEF